MSDALHALAEACGLVWSYWDGAGRHQHAPDDSLRAALAALGHPAADDAQAEASLEELHAVRSARALPEWAVVTAGEPGRVALSNGAAEWHLTCEDGTQRSGQGEGWIEFDPLPAGYHWLSVGDTRMPLLAAPARLEPPRRCWGLIGPLYGLRPEGQGGIGDYADLARLAETAAAQGAAFVGINPVHAGFPEDSRAFSPYSPSSREWFATIHIAADGAGQAADGALIDYDRAIPAKLADLRDCFACQSDDAIARFTEWRAGQGRRLELFATHQALSEVYGAYWSDWPATYRDPDSAEVAEFTAAKAEAVTFHAWLQWQAETQLRTAQGAARAAGMAHGIYLDLAVGTHPQGAETWADQALFASGVSLGAPPDAFAPDAQVWNLAPLRPDVLAARGFAPLIRTLRRQLAFAGVLRIDHILLFERAFWVPDGLPGVYVPMPKDALLAIARIEATRAGSVIVGEDLGVIPDGLRDDLARSGLYGCRLAMFERNWHGDRGFIAPDHYPEQVIASFGSHDLPLWNGWRAGRDIEWRRELGDMSAEEAAQALEERARDVARFDAASGDDSGSLEGVAGFVARSRARLAAVQIEDLMGMVEQPNLPGTVYDHPNWRRRLAQDPAGVSFAATLERVARIMGENGR